MERRREVSATEQPIRVFIVDDEILSINYMKRMLEEDPAHFALCGSATSAAQALLEIPRLSPDVILADINMPGMSGLDMVERLKEQPGHLPVVLLLTAYKDFEYAKRGLQLGVSGYLLKHEVTRDQLLEECTTHLKAARMQRLRAHSYTERSLRKFLRSGGQEPPPLPRRGKGNRYYLMGIYVRRPFCLDGRRHAEAVFDCVQLEDADFGGSLSCRYALQMDSDAFCAIFSAAGPEGAGRRQLQSAAARVREAMAAAGLDTSVIIDEGVDDVLPMPNVYKRLDGLGRLLRHAGKSIVFAQDHPGPIPPRQDWASLLVPVVQHMEKDERDAAATALAGLLNDGLETATHADFEELGRQVMQALQGYCTRARLQTALSGIEDSFGTAEVMRDFFLEAQQRIFRAQDEAKNTGYSPKTVKALEYLRGHYAEDIAAEDVATAAGLSEGHLRKLFRAEVGRGLVDYLTDLRIQKACELLDTGDYRVVDVYREVGFTSSQYFSSVFKKRMGVSPNEYMRR